MTAEKIPEKFGRYEVIGELGRGSMGMVYKARDPVIGRLVAIKAIPETFGLDPDKRKEYIKRLEREAITAGRLQHPNIVTIYDVGESEYGPYIAMEFLDGITLREIISSGKKLTLVQVAEFIRQAADGLDYAHSRAVIHRDIKPANLMLVENIVKIMDLGIARLPVSDLTREGKLVGSPSYMSPEQVQGKQLDGRSDLFSLGIVIYQATTGYKPFSGKDVHEICYKIVTEDFEPPARLNPSLPEAFDRLMERALAKNPEDRFQTGGELFMACRELIMTEEDRQALPQEHEKTTVVTGGQTDEASQVEVTSNPQLTSISDIDEIFRDLTTGHRTLRLDQSASKTRVAIWIAWIAAILAAAALVLWIIFGGR